MMKRLLFLLFCFPLLHTSVKAQDKFLEANTIMEDKLYSLALPIWLELAEYDPDNSNINYKVGLCYINSANDKKKALPYLIKASENTAANYDPFSSAEDRAPNESYFYLGSAYHLNYQLDSALSAFALFKQKVSQKHFLYKEADHRIEQCKNAKEAIKNAKNTTIENLGPVINGEFSDFSPVLSIDESKIYFTSRRIRKDSSNLGVIDLNDGGFYEDIYVSDNYDGEWSEPELININTQGHEAIINTTIDGTTLFIYKDDNGDGNLYTSTLDKNNYWSPPVKLGSDINLESYETHVHISPDNEILYYVSDRKKGKGGKDIYRCKKLPTGDWALSQNLGDVINTPYNEDGVFLHPDGKTMYFSSQGHKSIGGYDIFYSKMDEEGNWGEPVNLGYPINTTDDDVFFVTSADGKRGYYSSFQEKGYGEKDIYKITMPNSNEKLLTLLTGSLKVKGRETPENALVRVTDVHSGELIGKYTPRKKDGRFSIILEPDNTYLVEYIGDEFVQEEEIYVPKISAYQEISRSISLQDITLNGDGEEEIAEEKKVASEKEENKKENEDKQEEKEEKEELAIGNTSKVKEAKQTIESDHSSKEDVGKDVVAYYKEYFNYNVKKINATNSRYTEMVEKAMEIIKTKGKVTVDIKSSASHVPTRKYKLNSALAYKRAVEAYKVIVKSLLKAGAQIEQIVQGNIDSSAGGPKYRGDYKNVKRYKNYQYVLLKVK